MSDSSSGGAIDLFSLLFATCFAVAYMSGLILGIMAFAETKRAVHLVVTLICAPAGIYFYCKYCKKKTKKPSTNQEPPSE